MDCTQRCVCVLWPRPTLHIRAEVVAHLCQDEVDVLLRGDGMSRHAGGRVSRPGDGHLLPGQEEDDTPIAGGGVQQTHVVRTGGGRGGAGSRRRVRKRNQTTKQYQ